MNLVWLKLTKRILTHKYYVAKYCFQIGFLLKCLENMFYNLYVII